MDDVIFWFSILKTCLFVGIKKILPVLKFKQACNSKILWKLCLNFRAKNEVVIFAFWIRKNKTDSKGQQKKMLEKSQNQKVNIFLQLWMLKFQVKKVDSVNWATGHNPFESSCRMEETPIITQVRANPRKQCIQLDKISTKTVQNEINQKSLNWKHFKQSHASLKQIRKKKKTIQDHLMSRIWL